MRRCLQFLVSHIPWKTGEGPTQPYVEWDLRVFRYLEDLLPLLSYRPSGKGVKAPTEKERNVLAAELGGAPDEKSITALHAITRAEKVDIEVSSRRNLHMHLLIVS